jgi:hypothetical protein
MGHLIVYFSSQLCFKLCAFFIANSEHYTAQTALMQACLYGHWKVVQILVLFKANVSEHYLAYFWVKLFQNLYLCK